MEWIAIPLGAIVMAGTFAGGWLGLRFADALPTVLAPVSYTHLTLPTTPYV